MITNIFLFFSILSNAIVNGNVAVRTDFFYSTTVALGRMTKEGPHFFCSASVYDKNTVLTAAHCLYIRDSNPIKGHLYVFFGLSENDPDLIIKKLVRKKVHELYVPAHKNDDEDIYDIALGQFEDELPAGFNQVNLPDAEASFKLNHDTVLLAGFGFEKTSPASGSGVLRYTSVPIKKISSGKTEFVTNENLSGSCSIDSGGPVYFKNGENFVQVGIASRGDPGCVGEGEYTSVFPYINWVNEKINNLSDWHPL